MDSQLDKEISHQDSRVAKDRRVFSTMTIVKSFTQTRRRSHRRVSDNPEAHSDWYQPKLMLLVVGIMIMSMMDSFFTLQLLSRGAMEMNPVMDYFILQGTSTFILFKMLFTGFGVFVLTACSSYLIFGRFSTAKILTICFIAYVVLIAYELVLLNL